MEWTTMTYKSLIRIYCDVLEYPKLRSIISSTITLHQNTIPTSHSHLSIPHSTIIIFLFSITMSPPAKNKERASTGKSRKTSASRSTRKPNRVAEDRREAASRINRSRSQPAEKDSCTSQQGAESAME